MAEFVWLADPRVARLSHTLRVGVLSAPKQTGVWLKMCGVNVHHVAVLCCWLAGTELRRPKG